MRDADRKPSDMRGLGLAFVSSLCIALVPSFGRMAMDAGASLAVLLLTRCLIGGVFMIPIVILKAEHLTVARHHLATVIIASAFGVGMIASLYGAIRFMDVGLAILILYMYPLGIALVEHLRGSERITTSQWGALLVVAAGLVLLSADSLRGGNAIGIGLSFVGMICAMMFTIMSGHLARKIGASTVNFATNMWSVLFLAGLMVFAPSLMPVVFPDSIEGWLAILGNGIFFMLGYLLFFESSKIIGITRVSVITLVDPLLAALVAILLLSQNLTLLEWAGFAIITIALVVFEMRKQPPPTR